MTRRTRPALNVGAGERVLAWTESSSGAVAAGTREAFYVFAPGAQSAETRLPWEQVEAADWDRETSRLRVREVGSWGEERVDHTLTIEEPRRLLELVRERVTASLVLQRHVAVSGRRGVRVIARRAPHGDRPLTWFYEFDEGIDPEDPQVRALAAAALAAARDEVGG